MRQRMPGRHRWPRKSDPMGRSTSRIGTIRLFSTMSMARTPRRAKAMPTSHRFATASTDASTAFRRSTLNSPSSPPWTHWTASSPRSITTTWDGGNTPKSGSLPPRIRRPSPPCKSSPKAAAFRESTPSTHSAGLVRTPPPTCLKPRWFPVPTPRPCNTRKNPRKPPPGFWARSARFRVPTNLPSSSTWPCRPAPPKSKPRSARFSVRSTRLRMKTLYCAKA